MSLVKNFYQFTMLYFHLIWSMTVKFGTKVLIFFTENCSNCKTEQWEFYHLQIFMLMPTLYTKCSISWNWMTSLPYKIVFLLKILSIIYFQSALTHTLNPLVTSIPLKQKALNWAVFTYRFLQPQNMGWIILPVNRSGPEKPLRYFSITNGIFLGGRKKSFWIC